MLFEALVFTILQGRFFQAWSKTHFYVEIFLQCAVSEEARERSRLAAADEARREAKRQIELAEREFADAKRIRHQAQTELDRARAIRDRAVQQINSVLLQITCYACKKHFRAKPVAASDENSSLVATSYVSSVVTQVEAENDDRRQNNNKTKMDPFQ